MLAAERQQPGVQPGFGEQDNVPDFLDRKGPRLAIDGDGEGVFLLAKLGLARNEEGFHGCLSIVAAKHGEGTGGA